MHAELPRHQLAAHLRQVRLERLAREVRSDEMTKLETPSDLEHARATRDGLEPPTLAPIHRRASCGDPELDRYARTGEAGRLGEVGLRLRLRLGGTSPAQQAILALALLLLRAHVCGLMDHGRHIGPLVERPLERRLERRPLRSGFE
jgi:hypothetical protein